MNKAPKRFPVWATTFTILGIAILCGLGTWQVQRLEWKQNLIEQIEARDSEDFIQFNVTHIKPENEFIKGEIEGTFLFDKEIKLQSRTFDGTPGFHVITPLKLSDNNTIMVNRGWAPLTYETKKKDSKPAYVAGMIRKIRKPNMFVPPNTPEEDSWYTLDLEQIATSKNIQNILPVMLYEIDLLEGGHDITYPDPNALEIHINNNHMQYAFFWFSMAGALIAIYVLRFLKQN